jgi:Transposase, Mutator family/Homeodomain-like domain
LWPERVTQKVGEVAQTLMGVAPSASSVSRLNQSLIEQFEAWRERRLQEHWRILYLDGIHFAIRHGEQTDASIILTALGVDMEGNKEVLALRVCAEETNKQKNIRFRLPFVACASMPLSMRYTCRRIVSLLRFRRKEVVMEVDWVCKRAHLRSLLQQHADWSLQQLADAVGRSKSTVRRWKRRFAEGDPGNGTVLFSRPRAPHHHPARIAEEVVEQIIEMRLSPASTPQRYARSQSVAVLSVAR